MSDQPSCRSTFEELVGGIDYPMFIVTTRDGDDIAGCLAGFATQCSIDPPRFLVCLSEKNRTHDVALRADHLAVHLVPSSAESLAELFGGETGHEVDKFASCDWDEGPHGIPLLRACENWFAGRILSRDELGDHVGFLLEPVASASGENFDQFSFHRARRIEPGREP